MSLAHKGHKLEINSGKIFVNAPIVERYLEIPYWELNNTL